MTSPIDEEIQELMAKAELDEAETARLHLLLDPPAPPPRWMPRSVRRWIRRRALED